MTTHPTPPAPPEPNAQLATSHPSQEVLEFLAKRRSTPIKIFDTNAIGPTPEQLDGLLQIAARVPDHRKLEPWRFIIIEGDARAKLGEAIADIRRAEDPNASEADIKEDKLRFLRAPVVVIVVSSPDHGHKTPVWEQELSAGAACMNLLLASRAAGWSGAWLSEWCAFSKGIDTILELSSAERVAGFIYIGQSLPPVPERPRPNMALKVTRWGESCAE